MAFFNTALSLAQLEIPDTKPQGLIRLPKLGQKEAPTALTPFVDKIVDKIDSRNTLVKEKYQELVPHHPKLLAVNEKLYEKPLSFPKNVKLYHDMHSKEGELIVEALQRTAGIKQTKWIIDEFRVAAEKSDFPILLYFNERDASAENFVQLNDEGNISSGIGFIGRSINWTYIKESDDAELGYRRSPESANHNELVELTISLLSVTREKIENGKTFGAYEYDVQMDNAFLSEVLDIAVNGIKKKNPDHYIRSLSPDAFSSLIDQEIENYFRTLAQSHGGNSERFISYAIEKSLYDHRKYLDGEGYYSDLERGYNSLSDAQIAHQLLTEAAAKLGTPSLTIGDYLGFKIIHAQDNGRYYISYEMKK